MTSTNRSGTRLGAKPAWSVVSFYEDSAARERAIAFCDQLVSRFWEQCEFDVSWCPLVSLEKIESAKEAAAKAAHADVVVFSSTSEGDLPRVVEAWFETWLTQRGDREGLLVGLLEPATGAGIREGQKQHFLRYAAHRGSMDYLTDVPQHISFSVPDSLDTYTQRADQVSSLLNDILHRQTPPRSLLH